MKKGIGGHTRPYKGITNEWATPRHITEALGTFDLDPCAMPGLPWKHATNSYTIEDDGLGKEWVGRVWLNPPYGPDANYWLEKLAAHGNGIALIFARTETTMFFNHCWTKASGMLFLKGRLYFHYPDGTKASSNSGGPSVLLAYGKNNVKALRESGLEGALVLNFEVI